MGSPSPKETELIHQLRENVRDLDLCEEVLCDANLVRWLRARNLSVKDAESMFRNYVKWFDEVKLDLIFEHEVLVEVSEEMKQPICGFDYDGNPISVPPLGKQDLATLLKKGYKEEYLINNLQSLERNAYFARRLMAERQQMECVIQFSSISDLEGLSWRQYVSKDVMHLLMTQAKYIEAYYPETVNRIIIINAPRVFTLIWRMLTPFLSERTMAKIQIYGSNREQWEAALLKLAPRDSLLKKHGGTLPDDTDILPKPHECLPKKRGSY